MAKKGFLIGSAVVILIAIILFIAFNQGLISPTQGSVISSESSSIRNSYTYDSLTCSTDQDCINALSGVEDYEKFSAVAELSCERSKCVATKR